MSDPISLAVVGCGYWGPNLIRNFHSLPGADLVALCDLNEKLLAKQCAAFPQARPETDFARLLDDDGIEAVAIAAPGHLHFALCADALRAGKHVFVEKPLTTNTRDAAELVQLAEDHDRILMVGHLLLYHPAVSLLKSYVDSGALGKVRYFYSQRLNLGRVSTQESAIWSFAPHDVAVALYLLEAAPVEASAMGGSYLTPGVADVAFVNLRFAEGQVVHIHVSWLDPHRVRRMTVVGSEKMAVFDDVESTEKVRLYDKGVQVNDGAPYSSYGESLTLRFGDITIPRVDTAEPLKLECQHFLDCIAGNSRPLSDGENGLQVVRILEAAHQSLERGGAPVAI